MSDARDDPDFQPFSEYDGNVDIPDEAGFNPWDYDLPTLDELWRDEPPQDRMTIEW